MLTRVDEVDDRWWLYRIGQELGACRPAQALFRRFVRTFVLGTTAQPSTNGAAQPGTQATAAAAQ